MDYFFQNIFTGLTTIFAGSVVWIVYLYTKRREKIDAATIILIAIIRAEREMDKIKEYKGITGYTSILILNHWSKLQYLFTNNFDEDQFIKTTNFFRSCELAEETIKLLRSYLPNAMEEKSRVVQQKLLELADRNKDEQNKHKYMEEKKKILDPFYDETDWFLPKKPKEDLIEYLGGIPYISITEIGMVLKRIKNAKWYKITL